MFYYSLLWQQISVPETSMS